MEVSMGQVVALGMGTVFVGLVCIVILISIMNIFFSRTKPAAQPATTNAAPKISSGDERLDSETVAAVSAALAETMGKDVSAIRITSIKKVN